MAIEHQICGEVGQETTSGFLFADQIYEKIQSSATQSQRHVLEGGDFDFGQEGEHRRVVLYYISMVHNTEDDAYAVQGANADNRGCEQRGGR